MRLLLAIALWAAGVLLPALGGLAADYYVCDCQTGAEAGCSFGSDANAGTSPAAPKQTITAAVTLLGAAACGDQILLCEGGVWTPTTEHGPITSSADCSANRITVDSYDPTGSFTQMPHIRRPAAATYTGYMFNLGYSGGPNTPFRGLTFRNIRLSNVDENEGAAIFMGGAGGTNGPFYFDNVIIDHFSTAVQIGGTNTTRVDMEDVQILNSYGMGMLGGPAPNSRFERLTFDGNSYGCTQTGGGLNCGGIHAWYLGTQSTTTGILIRDVTFTDSCETAWSGGACTCNIFAMRGGSGALVEDLYIDATDTGTRNGSYPCRVVWNENNNSSESDGMQDSTIRKSTFINVDNVMLCGAQRTTYENNVFVANDSAGGWISSITPTGLDVTNRADCAGGGTDLIGDEVTVRNNTTYISVTDVAEMRCLAFRMTEGDGNKVYNNSCTLVNPDSSASSGFDYNDPTDTLADNNHVYRQNGSGSYGRINSSQKTLAQMRTDLGGCPATGNECSSFEGIPLFVSAGSDFALQSTSPLKDAGSGPEASSEDILGNSRPQGFGADIGAYEFVGETPNVSGGGISGGAVTH